MISSASMRRDLPLASGDSALLVVDMQNQCCLRAAGNAQGRPAPEDYYYQRLERQVVPHIAQLIGACRGRGIEVMYCVIEALTLDGRDRSLDHKLSDWLIPRGSSGGRVIDALAPQGDEIVLKKTASGVFNATNIEYLLRNMGIVKLAICGVYTNQCVESAVRDAADRGFLATLIEDACAARTPEGHAATLAVMAGYARIAASSEILAELDALPLRGAAGRVPMPAA
jgi:ureidoacrylate peracid hydrolase